MQTQSTAKQPSPGSLSLAATLAHYQRQLKLAQAQSNGSRRSER